MMISLTFDKGGVEFRLMKAFLVGLLSAAFAAGSLAENIVVRVTDAGGLPVQDAQVAVILKSGAHQMATRDPADGDFKCQPAEQCVKVFVAAPNFEGGVKKHTGAAGAITVPLKANPEKSSAIAKGWARLPGVEGAISLNYSTTGRYSMDAGKIGFEEKKGNKPVGRASVDLNRQINAITNTGQKFKIWVVDIMPQVALVEYSTPR